MPLLRTKHPRQNERNAIGSLGHGGGGGGVGRGRWGGRLGTHRQLVCGLGWRWRVPTRGARRRPAAVAAGAGAPTKERRGLDDTRAGGVEWMLGKAPK
jgi:hypothetical protein